MSRFDNIVSLGAWCQVSYQIGRRYGRKSTSPFDWIVTPWPGMISILRDGTENLAQQLVLKADASSAKCLKYDILIPHDLSVAPDGQVVFSAEKILAARSKYKHKFGKMVESASRVGTKNLFIRMGGIAQTQFAWPYLFDTAHLTHKDIDDLVEIIKWRCSGNEFTILIVQDTGFCHDTIEKELLPQNVFMVNISGRNQCDRWEGSDEVWDNIFQFIESPGTLRFLSLK